MQEYEVKTRDNLSIVVKNWNKDDFASEKVLLIIHGLGEHQGRYEHIADYFKIKGYSVFTYDQRGHGLSGGKRGHSPGIEYNLDDLEDVIASIKHSELYLYGLSFGGNVLVNYLLRRENKKLKSAILSGAWMKLKIQPSKIDLLLATVMNLIYPSFTQKNKLDITELSNIEEVGEKYLADPLVHSMISARLFKNFYASGLFAIENAKSLKTPTLLIHGSDDKIVDPNGSKEFASRANNATLKIYSNTKHELHNDNKAEEVLNFISIWLEGK